MNKPADTNTITDPEKIVPVTSGIKRIRAEFTKTFDPYPATVLQINTVTK